MSFDNFASLIAVLISAASIYIAWRKAPAERRATDADGALKSAQASGLWAEQNAKLLTRIDALETEISATRMSFEGKLAAMQSKLDERDRLVQDWQIGIDRLIMQIGSRGDTPVWRPNRPDWLTKPRENKG